MLDFDKIIQVEMYFYYIYSNYFITFLIFISIVVLLKLIIF